ncbi:ferredoxin [Streptomyces sparsogenes]|uniref:ferredoxin n=1 Tax=Streptomyces TaxID=1883 RepID=UPI002996EC99|nr:ferredoxin [Streptomyces sp. ME19-01-6]MDW6064153.1 ferredoxin [Streptomyces sp. FXJ1.4098]MDX3232323.1 ferredoxin [Streptomyces sp. ME19-01-6]
MRIIRDTDTCVSTGMCALLAPEVFTQNEKDGTVEVTDAEPQAELHELVRRAVANCPVRAISIDEEIDEG